MSRVNGFDDLSADFVGGDVVTAMDDDANKVLLRLRVTCIVLTFKRLREKARKSS